MQGLDSGKSLYQKKEESQLFTQTNENPDIINSKQFKVSRFNSLNKQNSIIRKKTISQVNEIDEQKLQNGFHSPFTNYVSNLEEQQQKDSIIKTNSFCIQNEFQSENEGSPSSQKSRGRAIQRYSFKDFDTLNSNPGLKINVEDVFSYEYLQFINDNSYIPSDGFYQKQKQKLKKIQQQKSQKKVRESILSKFFRYRKINQVADNEIENKDYIGKRTQYQVKKRKYDFIISPDSPFRITWDISIMMLIIYAIILIPFRVSFDPNDQFSMLVQLDNIFDFVFLGDILLNFNTAIYRKGNLIRKRKQIAIEYLKIWFWIDLFSSFPYDMVVQSVINKEEQQLQTYDTQAQANTSSNQSNQSSSSSAQFSLQKAQQIIRILKIFKIMKVLKLLRVVKLKFIIEKLVEYLKLSKSMLGILGFLKLSSIILFIAHWVACMWFYVGSQFPDNGWIVSQDLQNETWQFQYVTSIYWAITTMVTVGYGDIVPKNLEERLFVIFVMLMACGIFAYTMNTMGSVLSQIESFSSEYKKEIQQVNIYLDNKKIKLELKIRIRKYLEYIYESKQKNQIDETNLFSKLSSSLRNELIHQINEKIINDCHLFTKLFNQQNMEQFLFQISINLLEKITIPEEIIINQEESGGDDDQSMYFIQDGEVEIFYQHSNSKTILKKLGAGSYFGEISFFTNLQRTASVQSVNFASLYYLKRSEFIKILQKFPNQKEIFYEISDKIKNYNNFNCLNIQCFSCQQLGHISKNCPNLSFYFFKDQFIEKMLQNRKKKGTDFQRRNNLKLATIRDIDIIKHSQQKLEQTPLILSYIRVHDLDKEIKEDQEFLQTGNKLVNTLKKAILNSQKINTSHKNQKKAQQIFSNQQKNELNLQMAYWTKIDEFDKVKIYDHYFIHNNVEQADENDQFIQNGHLLKSSKFSFDKISEKTPQNPLLIHKRRKFVNAQGTIDKIIPFVSLDQEFKQQSSQIQQFQEDQSESSESSVSKNQSYEISQSQQINKQPVQNIQEKQESENDKNNDDFGSQAQTIKNSQKLIFFDQMEQNYVENIQDYEDYNLQISDNQINYYNQCIQNQIDKKQINQLNQSKSLQIDQM
ncbi:cation channel family protein (macronuclear) [Tetrahymena thermophila SB210]|uniref:Cation channel family protein n=1 Tax=Tetrahymena thermophila (strain SB210) TaxID=312017 RepID=I7MD75_TETTS|nr:cation channel family protein [Tetrahymena thermophila SB210]EAR85630.2 cation channel family protein [Tetrahymena thermophila SB210]|eukprot:XP_001033293.2 cation channel family protein [Tetrahymena thermophila SB210]